MLRAPHTGFGTSRRDVHKRKDLTSDVLIGCDGAASKVRACVFGGGVVNYTGQVAFRALLVPADEMRFFSLAIDILPPPPVTCDAA